MREDDTELLIGAYGGEHIRVVPRGRSHPDSSDYWDGNWIACLVEISVGAFRASYTADLRAEEFAGFRERLEILYERLTGTAAFASMEEWLSIEISGNGLGHLEATCEASDSAGKGNLLTFRLSLDQTQIPGILRNLQAIEDAFPIIGDPHA